MYKPSLSIYMPNYNHAHYISEALESILAQSFRPLEVIVIDDASTDNSVDVIESFVRRDPVIRLMCNDRNMGIILTEKQALEALSGDYVFGISADDEVRPGLFEKSMNLLAKYPQAGFSCTDPTFLSDETGMIQEVKFQLSDTPRYFSPSEFRRLLSWQTSFSFPTNTILWKRSALMEAGGFLPELKWHCDWFAAFVIAFRYGFCYIPENLAVSRMHGNSYHHTGMKSWDDQCEVLGNLLRLINSPEYADIRRSFKIPAVLSRFGLELLYSIVKKPAYWHHFFSALVLFITCPFLSRYYCLGKIILDRIPSLFKRMYCRVHLR